MLYLELRLFILFSAIAFYLVIIFNHHP